MDGSIENLNLTNWSESISGSFLGSSYYCAPPSLANFCLFWLYTSRLYWFHVTAACCVELSSRQIERKWQCVNDKYLSFWNLTKHVTTYLLTYVCNYILSVDSLPAICNFDSTCWVHFNRRFAPAGFHCTCPKFFSRDFITISTIKSLTTRN